MAPALTAEAVVMLVVEENAVINDSAEYGEIPSSGSGGRVVEPTRRTDPTNSATNAVAVPVTAVLADEIVPALDPASWPEYFSFLGVRRYVKSIVSERVG